MSLLVHPMEWKRHQSVEWETDRQRLEVDYLCHMGNLKGLFILTYPFEYKQRILGPFEREWWEADNLHSSKWSNVLVSCPEEWEKLKLLSFRFRKDIQKYVLHCENTVWGSLYALKRAQLLKAEKICQSVCSSVHSYVRPSRGFISIGETKAEINICKLKDTV